MALVLAIRRHLSVTLANQFSVYKQVIYIDIGQQPAVFIPELLIKLEAHRFAGNQTTVDLKGFLAAIFRQLVRVVGFGGVDSQIAHLLATADDNRVAVDHGHHRGSFSTPRRAARGWYGAFAWPQRRWHRCKAGRLRGRATGPTLDAVAIFRRHQPVIVGEMHLSRVIGPAIDLSRYPAC